MTDKGYSASGFSKWAGICAILLVAFSVICVLSTKEKNVVYGEKTKFSFKKIFSVVAHNDQLVVFMIFAYLIPGLAASIALCLYVGLILVLLTSAMF